ncbi:MAG: PQQ-dependent sugar dehydrogenase, partial [Corynebacterium humireducens]|nr:PQQ-dependent sugar dehydrogenase [Corynebacterium humireducens]
MRRIPALPTLLSAASLVLAGCSSEAADTPPPSSGATVSAIASTTDETPDAGEVRDFVVTAHGTFNTGWAMTFLPGTDHLLIAERRGALQLRDQTTGKVTEVTGLP